MTLSERLAAGVRLPDAADVTLTSSKALTGAPPLSPHAVYFAHTPASRCTNVRAGVPRVRLSPQLSCHAARSASDLTAGRNRTTLCLVLAQARVSNGGCAYMISAARICPRARSATQPPPPPLRRSRRMTRRMTRHSAMQHPQSILGNAGFGPGFRRHFSIRCMPPCNRHGALPARRRPRCRPRRLRSWLPSLPTTRPPPPPPRTHPSHPQPPAARCNSPRA